MARKHWSEWRNANSGAYFKNRQAPNSPPRNREGILWLISEGKPVCEVARMLNYSVQYVQRVCKEEEIIPAKAIPGPKPAGFEEDLAQLHKQIGHDLFFYRQTQRNISYAELSHELGWSVNQITKAESGVHEFTLSQLLQLSTLLGKPLEELVKEKSIKVSACPTSKTDSNSSGSTSAS